MERAKRIATAFIGVAFAVNSCDPAVAQTSNRFIRQPAKAPANPTPAIAAPATPAASPQPSTPGSAAPPANTESQVSSTSAPPSTTTALTLSTPNNSAPTSTAAPTANTNSATNSSESVNSNSTAQVAPQSSEKDGEQVPSKEAAKQSPQDSQLHGAMHEIPFNFPSILSLSNSPDLVFDSLEPFPTVPELALEKSEKPSLELASPSTESRRPIASESLHSNANSASPSSARSGQLQWTPRGNASNSRSETYNSVDYSNSGSRTQLSSSVRSSSAFNARPNNSEWQDSPASNPAKTQIDSKAQRQDDKVEELAKQQRIRAELVSARITNDPRFASQSESQVSVTRIESPQGWQAIGTRLSAHVARCESLLRRGAFCSAREEAEAASMLLYRHIDLHDNLFRCEPAVQSANQALREAEDFLVALRSTSDGESIRRLVDAHETPVLKDKNLTGMSPLTAAQHYRQFAESRLVEAAQGHPWASELLYTVGRTYQAEADADGNRVDVLRMKAMAYYRASRTTLPSNAITCNQLGYLLLQMDRNAEAREALVAAVTLKQEEAFLSNLAEASRRLGDSQTVAWATQSVAAIRRRTPPPSPVPPYVEVSQEDFIAISPREIGPKTTPESGASSAKPADRTASGPNTNQLR